MKGTLYHKTQTIEWEQHILWEDVLFLTGHIL